MSRLLTIALACGAVLLAPGCGGDDEKASDTDTSPTITVPSDDTTTPTTETTPPQTQPTPPPQTTPEDSGGSTAPATPDSPENDTKPQPNTPEQRFEEFCDQNPGACG
jgi:hypothetical protein